MRNTLYKLLMIVYLVCLFQKSFSAVVYDPTYRPAQLSKNQNEPEDLHSLKPQMVLIQGNKQEVYIRGKSYSVGDMVGRFKILRITPFQLDFLAGKTKRTLKIEPQIIKKNNK